MTPAPQVTCVRACSACSGDYEDPERTAWPEASDEQGAEDEGAENASRSVPREGFPAVEK